MKSDSNLIIVNITYNSKGWMQITDDSSNFDYVKQGNAPHESLNFNFNKENIDTTEEVFGHLPIPAGKPRGFISSPEPRIVLFYSSTPKGGKFVGVYGGATWIEPWKKYPHKGFKDGVYEVNVSAKRNLSFKIPDDLYVQSSDYFETRAVPQAGLRYCDRILFKKIIEDLKQKYLENEIYKNSEDVLKINNLLKILGGYNTHTKENIDTNVFAKNVILYGPPGTGKTYITKKYSINRLGGLVIIETSDSLSNDEITNIILMKSKNRGFSVTAKPESADNYIQFDFWNQPNRDRKGCHFEFWPREKSFGFDCEYSKDDSRYGSLLRLKQFLQTNEVRITQRFPEVEVSKFSKVWLRLENTKKYSKLEDSIDDFISFIEFMLPLLDESGIMKEFTG